MAFSADTFNLDQRQTDPKSGSWRPRRCRNHLKFAFFEILKLHLSLQDRDLEGLDVSLHYAERIQMEMGGVAVMEKGNLQLQQRRHIIIIIIVAVMEMGKRNKDGVEQFSFQVTILCFVDFHLMLRMTIVSENGKIQITLEDFCTKMSFSSIYFSFCAFWRKFKFNGPVDFFFQTTICFNTHLVVGNKGSSSSFGVYFFLVFKKSRHFLFLHLWISCYFWKKM